MSQVYITNLHSIQKEFEDTKRLGGKDIVPDGMRTSSWCVKLSGSKEKKLSCYFSSMAKIVPFVKMPQDASTKIKILMKTHTTAALNSPWERSHKVRHTEPCNQIQSGSPFSFLFTSPQTPEFLYLILTY